MGYFHFTLNQTFSLGFIICGPSRRVSSSYHTQTSARIRPQRRASAGTNAKRARLRRALQHSPASGRGRAGLFAPSQHKGGRTTLVLDSDWNTDKTELPLPMTTNSKVTLQEAPGIENASSDAAEQ